VWELVAYNEGCLNLKSCRTRTLASQQAYNAGALRHLNRRFSIRRLPARYITERQSLWICLKFKLRVIKEGEWKMPVSLVIMSHLIKESQAEQI